uniref:Uncharacterized protein n=1 Tax=Canis lupus familiaris TaxID=9615 RepID=A0A8I3S5V6_CANLF
MSALEPTLPASAPGVGVPGGGQHLGLPGPEQRPPSRPPSSAEDSGSPPVVLALGKLRCQEEQEEEAEEEDEDEEDEEEQALLSEEHPGLFFAAAQRLRAQGQLLDERVRVGGRAYGLHRVVLAAVLTFAYEGRLGPAPGRDVLAAAEALRAPRVSAAARRRCSCEAGGAGPGAEGPGAEAPSAEAELRETLRSIELLYREGAGCDLELQAGGCRLRGERGPGRGGGGRPLSPLAAAGGMGGPGPRAGGEGPTRGPTQGLPRPGLSC